MKPHFFKTFLIKIITIVLVSCSDTGTINDQLPPITQTGANTFGCLVNGQVFVPKDSPTSTPGGSRNSLEVLVGHDFFNSNGNDKWFIRVSNYKDLPETYIYMYIPTLFNITSSQIIQESDGNENSNLQHPHIYCLRNQGQQQYRSYENSGEIVFNKIDIVNGIYTGVFNVKLKNKDNENDVIEITEGRFDINLNTINN